MGSSALIAPVLLLLLGPAIALAAREHPAVGTDRLHPEAVSELPVDRRGVEGHALGPLRVITKPVFDYFYFVREWGATYCEHGTCSKTPPKKFTIHGLWPEYLAGGWPEFCPSKARVPHFDPDAVADLVPEMQSEWPALVMADGVFWEHEWQRHGSCALSLFGGERAYFSSTLELHKKYDIAAALREAGVKPSILFRQYHTKDVMGALELGFGHKPQLHCVGDELNEVWMCIDKDLRPMSCPSEGPFACTGKIRIPGT